MIILVSEVEGHAGYCTPVWLNRNQVLNRLDGGVTGFFKNVEKRKFWFGYRKVGFDFHGILKDDKVYTTLTKEGLELLNELAPDQAVSLPS